MGKDTNTLPLIAEPESALVAPSLGVTMFERLAADPNVDVAKLERLMTLWERAESRKAELAWNAAMAEAQQRMGVVAVDAANPQTKSRYASLAALDDALRPIYTKYGFAVSFTTEPLDGPHVRILCFVSHVAGHRETFRLDLPTDGKGARGGDVMTVTHATAAAITYGMRYTLKMAFNIATGEEDDDGNEPEAERPPTPDGYDAWLADLEATADNGWPELQKAWGASSETFRRHLNTVEPLQSSKLKARAQAVTKGKK